MTQPHSQTSSQAAAYAEHPTFASYMVVFVVLCIFTAVSFITNAIFGIGDMRGVAIIMSVSVAKATLVAMFFMHLKYDWPKLYFIVIPVMILTVMMVVVLLPDIVFAWPNPR